MKRFLSSNPLDVLDEDSIKKLKQLEDCKELDFLKAAEILELDPASDFKHADLLGVRMSGLDLSEFSFTGAILGDAPKVPDRDLLGAKKILALLRDHLNGEQESSDGIESIFQSGKSGVYFWGDLGCGKTNLVEEFFGEVRTKKKALVDFRTFMSEFNESLEAVRRLDPGDAVLEAIKPIVKRTKLLCIDDLNVFDIKDAMLVGRIFDYLSEFGVYFVITSASDPRSQYKDGLNRKIFESFIDHIEEKSVVFHIDNNIDYRERVIGSSPTWLSTEGTGYQLNIDGIWQELTKGNERRAMLGYRGKGLLIDRYWGRNARIEFESFFDQEIEDADCLALSNSVSLLVLENVPIMDASMTRVARAFLSLIDALYESDKRPKLIVSADADPASLFKKTSLGNVDVSRAVRRLKFLVGNHN